MPYDSQVIYNVCKLTVCNKDIFNRIMYKRMIQTQSITAVLSVKKSLECLSSSDLK